MPKCVCSKNVSRDHDMKEIKPMPTRKPMVGRHEPTEPFQAEDFHAALLRALDREEEMKRIRELRFECNAHRA